MMSSMNVMGSGVLACGRRHEPCSTFRSVSWLGGSAKLGNMPSRRTIGPASISGQSATGTVARRPQLDSRRRPGRRLHMRRAYTRTPLFPGRVALRGALPPRLLHDPAVCNPPQPLSEPVRAPRPQLTVPCAAETRDEEWHVPHAAPTQSMGKPRATRRVVNLAERRVHPHPRRCVGGCHAGPPAPRCG
jgi:hypothetical protein